MNILKYKLVVKNDTYYTVLDENNKVVKDIITINDIDFSKLPSNIFNNVELYFGKEYELYNFDRIIDNLKNIPIEKINYNFESEFGKELLKHLEL